MPLPADWILFICAIHRQKLHKAKPTNVLKSVPNEHTPSASLKQLTDGIWVATDFGGDQVPRNGIQVYMKEESLTFREALVRLGGIYGIGSIKAEVISRVPETSGHFGRKREGVYLRHQKRNY